MYKKWIKLLCIMSTMISSYSIFAEESEVRLRLNEAVATIDEVDYRLDVAPILIQGNTYVELRFLAEQVLKATIVWDDKIRETMIIKEGKRVALKQDSGWAVINGTSTKLPAKVIVREDRVLVPLRFLAEEFGMNVAFNQSGDMVLSVTNQMSEPNTLPIAAFEFKEEVYTEGQQIEVRDQSYDEDGDALTKRIWRLDGDDSKTTDSFRKLMEDISPGIHKVSLKVCDEKGGWSKWAEQVITIKANEAPVITELKTKKESYAQGEVIEFEYAYSNEEWEEIVEFKWSYKGQDDADNKKIVGMPKALFEQGEHIVMLQLVDAAGKVSEVKEAVVRVTEKKLLSEFKYKFMNGSIGEVIDNFGLRNYRSYEEEKNVSISNNEDMLVMSNSPERVLQNGILYKETIEGKGRIMIHHINAFSETENAKSKKMIVILVENPNDEPVTLKVSNQVVKLSSTDQLYLGQKLLEDYLNANSNKVYTLQPKEKVYIYSSAGKRWGTEEGISGLMDFETTAPLKVKIAAVDEGTNMEEILALSAHPRDVHPRGTFNMTQINYDIELSESKPTQIVLGNGEEEWALGRDAINGVVVKNKGNYGITYKIKITAKEETGVILNPRGGLFRGAIRWDDNRTYLIPKYGFLPSYERSAVLGIIKAGETREFEYMLPNGSAAPVLIGFIPQSSWNQ